MKKKVGLIPSPDLPAKIINQIVDQLKISFESQVSSQIDWDIEVKVGIFVGAAEYVNEIMKQVIEVKETHGWDYAISITDLPNFSEKKAVIADVSTTHHVGIISLPSFGAFPIKKRISKAITHIIELLYKHNEDNIEKEVTTRIDWRFLFSKVMRVEPEEDAKTDIRFVLNSKIIGWLRILSGMIFANRPWRAVGTFKKMLTLAFATGIYISIFSTPWQLSVSYTPKRFIALMILSMLGMVIWTIFAHHLWEKPTSKSQSQYRRLYNVTTVITLFVITFINYLVLFILFLLSISLFVPEGIFDAVINEGTDESIENYLRLAWLTTSLSILVGAVGATVEKEEKIREVTYSYRQKNRYYEIEKQDENDEDAKTSYDGVQQSHKEQDES